MNQITELQKKLDDAKNALRIAEDDIRIANHHPLTDDDYEKLLRNTADCLEGCASLLVDEMSLNSRFRRLLDTVVNKMDTLRVDALYWRRMAQGEGDDASA